MPRPTRAPSRKSTTKPGRPRLALESLEDRDNPSDITVTTLADTVGGPGVSLRDAIIQANANPGDDFIRIIPTGTITLTQAGAGEDAALTGDLDVTDTSGSIFLYGALPGATVIDADGLDRVFDVRPGARLVTQYVTVQGGVADYGGGFRNEGILVTTVGTLVTGNVATVGGGGIANIGTDARVTATSCTFLDNRAGDINNPADTASGGAVWAEGLGANFGPGVEFRGNTAGGGGTGGAIAYRGTHSVNDTKFVGNRAGEGGAISLVSGRVTIETSTFDGNAAVRGTVNGSPGGRGGALLVLDAATATVTQSTFVRNDASGAAGRGGAIAIGPGGSASVTNSTVSGNFAGTTTNSQSVGGGIYNAGILHLIHATVVNNAARFAGPGGGVWTGVTSAGVKVRNSIIALNGQPGSNAPDVSGAFASEGGNVVGNSTGSGGWQGVDLVGNFVTGVIDPLIGPLQDNGGKTQTHALLPGSPAIDFGVDNPPSEFIQTDQRSLPRLVNGRVDAGAFEVQAAANQPPVARPDAYATDEDAPLSAGPLLGVLANDSDPDGQPLTAAVAAGPAHGSLALKSDGSFTYTPAADFNGTDSFTYTVSDGNGGTATGSATVTVTPVNDPPVADPKSVTVTEDGSAPVTPTGADPDGDSLAFAVATQPQHGSVSPAPGGFLYTPNPDYNGTDSFTYTASDGTLTSAAATVTVTVNAVNDAPVAVSDSATTDEDAAKAIAVLANDSDVDGDALKVSAVTQGAHGGVAINADGSLTYTPAADFNGSDSFTYTASDGNGGTATATVSVTVNAVNDPPVAVNDSFTLNEDAPLSGGVLANDTDVDSTALAAILVSGPKHGSVTLKADGSFTYTPAANYNGTDSFTYKANDGAADGNVATVGLTINAVNDAPDAADDLYATAQGTPLAVAGPGVLADDADADGDALQAELVSGPAHGTLKLNADGSFVYTPAAGFSGSDSFTYRASDGSLGGLATVTIQVAPAPATEGKVTGAGAAGAGSFKVNVQSREAKGGLLFSGSVSFQDAARGIDLQSTSISYVRVESDGVRATISGTATVNGKSGYSFTAYLDDHGQPGRGDSFRIVITGPGGFVYDSSDYDAAGLLDAGNLQVHRK
jgi:VCBS repeat-containing protein